MIPHQPPDSYCDEIDILCDDEVESWEEETLIYVDIDECPPPPPPLPPLAIGSEARPPPRVGIVGIAPPAPPPAPLLRALPFKLRPVSPWSFEAYRGQILARAPARTAARPPVPPPWMMSLPPLLPPSSATILVPADPPRGAPPHPTVISGALAPPKRESRALLFAMVIGLAVAGWYAAAVRYQTEQASARAASATQTAREAPEPPASSVMSPRLAPVRGAMPASFAPVPIASAKLAPPKVDPKPQPRAELTPVPKKAPPAPKVEKPAQSASMERTLQAAKQETESTLN